MSDETVAEVVESKRPEVPKCPEMWVVQMFSRVFGWQTVASNGDDTRGHAEAVARTYQFARLVRIPGEIPGESTPAPAMPESVRALVKWLNDAATFHTDDDASAAAVLIVAVEKAYGAGGQA